MLESDELTDYRDAVEEMTPHTPFLLFRLSEPVTQPSEVPTITTWPDPIQYEGRIDVKSSLVAQQLFEDPNQETATLLAWDEVMQHLRAGDVIADSQGRVWVTSYPVEDDTGIRLWSCTLRLVSPNLVPASMGVIPVLPEDDRPTVTYASLKHMAFGTFENDDSGVLLRVRFDTSGSPVPAGSVVLGFSSRGNMDPEVVTGGVSPDGRSVVVDFLNQDPLEVGVDWATITY